MDVMQAIKERRSVRKFLADPVTDEQLQTVLEAARWAPSWANTQCPRFIIVRTPEVKSRLAETLSPVRPNIPNGAADAVRHAPVVIVACAEKSLSGCYRSGETRVPATDKGEWWYMFDVGLAMQNITLAAHALGLGTVHVGLFDAPKVAGIVGAPDNVAVVEILPLGWPEKPSAAPRRKELAEFVFNERFPAARVL